MRSIAKACSIFVVFVFVCSFQTQNAHASVFASQLKISNPDSSPFDGNFSDGTGALFSFILNDTASTVTINVINSETGSSIAQIDGGPMSAGTQSVVWSGAEAAVGNYVFEVTAEQPNYSDSEWTMFFDSGDIEIFTRGVAVVTAPRDANFGLIFTSNDGGALGTGINIFNADGSFHDPFLVAADISSGGAINYGTEAPLFPALDSLGRIYVANRDLGQIMRINRDFTATAVIQGLTSPKGIYLEGAGDDFTIYVAANNQILRGNLGTAESMMASAMEVVGTFTGFFPHQIILDDEGALFVTLRMSNDLGSDGRGIRKYDVSGTLPVTDSDAVWFLAENKTFIANDLLMDRGEDRASATDDILYYVTRAGGGFNQDGIWRIDDINSFFPDTVRIITEQAFYGADDNVQARATIDFDAAGNIVFMENANEHVFMFAPPGEGETNSFTTTSPDTFTVEIPVSVEETADSSILDSYRLEANYPNPFNPSTTIRYTLGKTGETTLKVYNLRGEAIRVLADDNQAAGEHAIVWDGKDDSGRLVSSGVYILTIKSGEFRQSHRMTLVK